MADFPNVEGQIHTLQGEQTAENEGGVGGGEPVVEGGGEAPPGQTSQRRNYRTRVYRNERPAGQNENDTDAVSDLT